MPEEIVEGEENLDVTPEDNSEVLDVRLFSFMPDDESIDYFKDFYIQHAWTPGISNSIVVYKYDGTVICEKEYNVSENVRIGAGSVVIDNVPEHSTVVGIPARVVAQRFEQDGQLQHNRIPDPVQCALNRLKYEVQDIKETLEKINNQ